MKNIHLILVFSFSLLCSIALSSSCSAPNTSEPQKEGKISQKEKGKSSAEETTEKSTTESVQKEPKQEKAKELPAPEPQKHDAGGQKEAIAESQPDVQEQTPEKRTQEATKESVPDAPQVPKAGFGKISGSCGILDDKEWKSTKPFFFQNSIDFGKMAYDKAKLSKGGKIIASDGNLGGSSVKSEIFSFEVLYRCELAALLKSESKIIYKQSKGKKTDILVRIDNYKIGVSVTRAYKYPAGSTYLPKDALKLLKKKLADILLSKANADPSDAWSRSILHILAYNKQHADTIKVAYQKIDAKVKAKTILFLTTTDGNDKFIYSNK